VKRDMDLIRAILLAIDGAPGAELRELPNFDGYSHEQVAYHARMLKQAGFVSAIDATTFDGEDYLELSLSWDGHEFLETVRDGELWKKTKESAGKVGNWGVKLLAELAIGAARAKAARLGIPLA